jgi:proteasome component ECM29
MNNVLAEYAATVSMGWLVKYGLNQPCAEATGIYVSTLLGIVDIAAPSILQPVLGELIGLLLMALSGLDPAALNYLQVRASG